MEPIIHILDSSWGEKAELTLRREHQSYKNSQGVRLPGVTTVLGLVKESSYLIEWAWKLGKEGIDYRQVRDKAADVGSLAHFLCECWLTHKNPVFTDATQEDIDKAFLSFDKFVNFWEKNNLRLRNSELQLSSDIYGYGGTIDIIADDPEGNKVIVDIKTSKYIYKDYVTQVFAYELLSEQVYSRDISKDRRLICRIGKEKPSDFEVLEIPSSAKYLYTQFFLDALKTYKSKQQVEKYNKENDFLQFKYGHHKKAA